MVMIILAFLVLAILGRLLFRTIRLFKTLMIFSLGGLFFLYLADIPFQNAKVGMDRKILSPLKHYIHDISSDR